MKRKGKVIVEIGKSKGGENNIKYYGKESKEMRII